MYASLEHVKVQLRVGRLLWISCASVVCLSLDLAYAQAIQPELILERYPRFDPADIANAGIKSIRIKESIKPSLRPVYDQNIRFTTWYDKKGHLIGYQKTFPGYRGRMDTIKMEYSYKGGAISKEVESLGKYQRMVKYERIDASTEKQIISTRRGNESWELFETEKLETVRFKNGEAIMIGGMYDVPYQKIVTEWNADSTEIESKIWTGSRIQSRQTVHLSKDSVTSYLWLDLLNKSELKITFPIDYSTDTGYWCEDQNCRKYSIVLNDKGWPKAWILMNEKTEDMEIWEFQYFYFDK